MMLPLDKTLRNRLERTIKNARDIAEDAARAALGQLGVGEAAPFAHLNEQDRELRRKLRVHGRQLGDSLNGGKIQTMDRLIEEVAYEHWHRMLFARFLAENNLLMYPDPDDPVAVTLEECEDLATDEGVANGWELAARFAARMLPQIFRLDSPVFQLGLPPEHQQKLERLIADLELPVFTASDSLGWVYQFWQAKKKDEVNASEVKIGARELPAVTQLFTEPYMVSFLLDNSLGTWWAARRLTEADLKNASNEEELRQKAAIPGVPLEYLRFVQQEDDRQDGGSGAGAGAGSGRRWTPAAGTFDGWPELLADLKTLDPCCGSGHFLVATFLMLVPMRMERDCLSAKEAVDAVLRENIHGLELDQRCVELAAFALALTAWKYPDLPTGRGAGGEGWSNDTLAALLKSADHTGKSLENWLREKFFTQHCKLFQHRPFIWHIWDGLQDGFAALVNYHKLDAKLLETLIYTYLGDWISRQKQDIASGVDGAQERLAAAEALKKKLELILIGEAPYDLFVRWKPLEKQPIGWDPDLNDGVRLNIRPFLTVPEVGKKGAGVLRDKPNIKWTKDRGKDVESASWYHLFKGDRINDHHLPLAEKHTVPDKEA